MGAAALDLGRFDIRFAGMETALGMCALSALAAVPVVQAPAALLFLMAGMSLFMIRPVGSLVTLLHFRILLMLPLFCLLSTLWSIYPAQSLRFAVQLAATFVIAILIADRVSLPAIVLTVFTSLFALVFLSVAIGPYRSDTGALVGLFGSKNEMAGMATLFSVIAFGLAASPEPPRLVRFAAAAGVLIGVAAMALAQSAGAFGYLPFGIGAYVSVLLVRRLSASVRIVAGVFLFLTTVLAALVTMALADEFARAFFELTGKDVTLTGRVELWQVALNLIAERPFLGTGYQAFWVHGYAPAEALWAAFGIESRSGFNFHNAYLSNAVEIGLTGVAIQSLLLAAAVLLPGRLALKTGSHGAALLFAIAATLSMMTLLEAPVFFQFNLWTVLVTAIVVRSTMGSRTIRASRSRSWSAAKAF